MEKEEANLPSCQHKLTILIQEQMDWDLDQMMDSKLETITHKYKHKDCNKKTHIIYFIKANHSKLTKL